MGEGKEKHSDSMILPTIPSNDDYAADPEVWDLIVVGAGVAGAALAYRQGQDHRRVLLLERDFSQPDRIVGELLQPGGYLMLKKLGLEDTTDGIDSVKVHGYAIYKDGKYAAVRYPTEGYSADVAGRSFHHGRFVQKLRLRAASQQSVTCREATVRKLINDVGEDWSEGQPVSGVKYKAADGSIREARAHLSVVCDGMYSNFRKPLTESADVVHPSFFVGLLLRNVALPYANHGHVVLAEPSPVLFYPISPTEVRCLVDVPGPKLPADLPGYLRSTVAPQVPPELQQAFLTAIDNEAIRSMQNKQVSCQPMHQPGALLLGDAFNMRHPLTGGGMTVALSDTRLLCEMLQPLPSFEDAIATARSTAEFYTKRKPVSATINTLANALYKVFCVTGSDAHEEMRQACFDYLAKGGACSSGPVSLLSGLNPSPSMLVMHFFSVALFGVGRLLRPRPTFRGLYMCIALLIVASRIILPIIWVEGLRAVFFPSLAPKPLNNVKRVESLRSMGSMGGSTASALASSASKGLSKVR
ncbi:hypothetical protein OEZ85_007748 [Tetradesmus obliquus]|uniref:Squalene monooxygenase n=1 Tax=Tetradesmus obliquus TaxID=3088 RepID=A0ABY8TH30_TETOB|nr:hypothetical protein OEZ85_007748 [Tetradesmus obliquus]